jgi:type IV secretion system protein VirD4
VCGRRRAEFGPVHVLDLDDGPRPRAGLNPLDLAWRQGGEPGVVARSFAAALVQRPPAERDPFWNDWAESLISAGFCGLLERGGDEAPTVGRLFDLFHSDDVVYNIARMLDEGKFKSRSSCSAMAGFLNLPERETRPSVQGTVQTHLRLFDSDLVRRLTDTTTIDREALVRGDPCTLFIAVPPDRLAAFAPLLRLWLTGLIHLLTRRRAPRAHRTLMLIDEAAQVGRMEAFLTASTLMRSWGLTVWSAWQNIAQIEIYGAQAKTLVDNAGVIQFFGVRNRRSAQEFAALVGGVDADAIMAMRPDEQLILVEGGQPRRARKLRYWEERRFHGLHDPNPMASAAGP